MHLRPKDFRPTINTAEGGTSLAISVRRSSLKPTDDSREELRQELARALGLGQCCIESVPCPGTPPRRGPLRILVVALRGDHLTTHSALQKFWEVIRNIASRLKVATHRRSNARKDRNRREHPLPRRVSLPHTCGGSFA